MSSQNNLINIIFNHTASFLPLLAKEKLYALFIDIVRHGKMEFVNVFINHVDIHYLSDLALREAVQYGHHEIVRLLLENDADLHAVNEESLRLATLNADYDMIKLLLNYGADIHSNHNFALNWCSWNYSNMEYRRIIDLLMEYLHVI